jgi:hypothetical protein
MIGHEYKDYGFDRLFERVGMESRPFRNAFKVATKEKPRLAC